MKIQGVRLQGTKLVPSGVAADEYFNLVALLLPGNGTNGAQNNTFIDSSTNNFTITRAGNTTQGTFSPFSQTGWSVFVNSAGSSTSTMKGLTTPNSTLFDMVNGGTVECWVYLTQYPAAGAPYFSSAFLFSFYGAALSGSTKYYGMSIVNTGALSIIRDYGGSNTDNTSSTIIPLNTWTHIAWSRISGSNYFFVNGTDITSTFTNPTLSGAWPASTTDYQLYVGLGAYLFNVYTYIGDFNGYISNFRVVKGSAVYSASFTPPTQPLTAVSGTSLLTCQSNRYIDNSTNALAITPLNTPSVQAFAPFDPVTAYAAGTVGGSGYFDGSGDYLSVPDNTAWNFGSGDFTVEAWYYPTVASAQQIIIGQWDGVGGGTGLNFVLLTSNNTGMFLRAAASSDGANVLFDLVSTSALRLNAWNHVALVRSGTTFQLYLNGAAASNGSTTSSASLFNAPNVLTVGASSAGGQLSTGYISSVRIVKGTAVYTGSTYTVPTAPVTAIANTQLLLNYTNGGITDATAKNVIETVGNAQISTAQSKFGGSSLFFDGNADALLAPSIPINALGTGDFTIEAWIRWSFVPNSGATYAYFFAIGGNTVNGMGLYVQNGKIKLWNTAEILAGSTTLSADTWYHVALVRSSGTVKLYLNGTQDGTVSMSSNLTGGVVNLGYWYNITDLNYFSGYMDDFRITRGYARYTANFTAPTTAFPTQ